MRFGRNLFDWDLNPFITLENARYLRFSDGGGDGGSQSAEGGTEGNQGGTGDGTGEGDNKAGDPPRTFTQEEVTRMMTAEKNQGRQSVLKELGVTDAAQAKTLLEMVSKLADTTKTDTQKLSEEGLKAKEAEQRAEAAEQKLELALAKVNKDALDDVLLLAKARMNDKTDFKAALEIVKKAHPSFFDFEGVDGTGGPPATKRKAGTIRGEYGKRAAEASKSTKPKTPGQGFFKHT